MDRLLPFFLALICVMLFETNLAYSAKIKDCKVSFSTTGSPGLITIDGVSQTPCKGNLPKTSKDLEKSEIVLNLENLETGISLRDRHLKEKYLEVDKYPDAKLDQIQAVSYDKQIKGLEKDTTFKATLELHGVNKEVQGKYSIDDGKNLVAKFNIKLSDFKIDIPSFMGVTVVDNVDIKVEISL